MNKIKSYISKQLTQRGYSEPTKKTYLYWVEKLIEYYGERDIGSYDESEVSDFLNDLKMRKKLSHNSVRQAISTMKFVFNKIGKKNYDFSSIQIGRGGGKEILIPTQDDILSLIEATPSKTNKLGLLLIYSMGLDIDELVSIRLVDLDIEKGIIKIPYRRIQGVRKAIVAEAVKAELYSYLRETSPQKWMLESSPGQPVKARTLQKSFAKVRHSIDINPLITIKSLKYAYVKHLESMGLKLVVIMDELGLSKKSSLLTYSELDIKVDKVGFSPLDRRLSSEAETNVEQPYFSDKRINEIGAIESTNYDLTKTLEYLHEINLAYKNRMYLAIPMLIRALIDHIPPTLGCNNFEEIASNYSAGRSFKKSMKHLNVSLRNIADLHLHTQVRRSEVLPTFNQVDFRQDLDLLLSEIVRVNKI